MDCRWVIVGPPGHIIKLTWMAFNLEESQTCSYDYLAVFDNTTIPGTGLLHPTHPFQHIWTSSPALHHIWSFASLKVVLLVSTVGTATPQIWPAQRTCSLSSSRGRYGGLCVLMIWLFKTTAVHCIAAFQRWWSFSMNYIFQRPQHCGRGFRGKLHDS